MEVVLALVDPLQGVSLHSEVPVMLLEVLAMEPVVLSELVENSAK